MTLTRSSSKQSRSSGILVLASLSGLLYSSWPLGYILNPGANQGLASNLQGAHQPFNWLFIALDVLTGLLVLAVAWMLLVMKKKAAPSLSVWAIYGYAAFGILTAIDAILPEDCLYDQHQCGAVLQHPLIIIHAVVSIASLASLTLCILAIWWLITRQLASSAPLRWTLALFLVVWFVFGNYTGILLALNQPSAWSQHIFITACSLWIGAFPFLIQHSQLRRNQHRLIPVAKNR